MQESVLYLVLVLLCVVIYLLLNQKKNKDDDKNSEELTRLKESFNLSISSFFLMLFSWLFFFNKR